MCDGARGDGAGEEGQGDGMGGEKRFFGVLGEREAKIEPECKVGSIQLHCYGDDGFSGCPKSSRVHVRLPIHYIIHGTQQSDKDRDACQAV
jgi:hypothetical protein